jgi:CRP-like cAMP-binding protein
VNNSEFANQILTALPSSEYQRLLPYLQPVILTSGQILYQSQEQIRDVYFPEQGLISIVTILENGANIEAARVGKDGVLGIPIILALFCHSPIFPIKKRFSTVTISIN